MMTTVHALPLLGETRVTTGAVLATTVTVSVAALDVAVPVELVNTARYWFPLIDVDVDGVTTVRVPVVLPASVVSLVNVVPPSVDTCHCTVGAGLPDAAAVNVAVEPAVTEVLAGCVVTAGVAVTVSVATLVVAVPAEFVNTARYCVPFWAVVVDATVSVVDVAPLMFVNVELPLGADCHCTVGAGVPEAAAVNVAVLPAATVTLVGCVVITGAALTVSVAGLDVAVPTELVNTASYLLPDCAAVAPATVSVPLVLPASVVSGLYVVPPSVDTNHWTVGVGLPEAAAVNVALAPTATLAFAGCVETVGAKSTVSVAAVVVAVPAELVNTARYWLPFCEAVAAVIVSVARGRPRDVRERRTAVGRHLPLDGRCRAARWPPR